MISKKIDYVLQSKVSDSFLKLEYNKTSTFTANDFKNLNIHYENTDLDENIIVIQYFERHRFIKNFSKFNFFIRNKLDPENKIQVTNQPLILNEYFDAYELIAEQAKNRFKTLNFLKINDSSKVKNFDYDLIKQEDEIAFIAKRNNRKSSFNSNREDNKKLKENFILRGNSKEQDHLNFRKNDNVDNHSVNLNTNLNPSEKYNVLKSLPLNCQIKLEDIKQETGSNDENEGAFDNQNNFNNENNNNKNLINYRNESNFNNNIINNGFENKSYLISENNSKIQNKYSINPNHNLNMEANKPEVLRLVSPSKANHTRLNNLPIKNKKVIIDDLEATENSMMQNTVEKNYVNSNQSKIGAERDTNLINNFSKNNDNSNRKNSFLAENEKNDFHSKQDNILTRKNSDLPKNSLRQIDNKNQEFNQYEYQEQEENESLDRQKPDWICKRNNSALKENNLRIRRSKMLNESDFDEKSISENGGILNLHNSNIVRKTLNSNQNLSSLNLMNSHLQNNKPNNTHNNNNVIGNKNFNNKIVSNIKNSYIENITNSKLLSSENIIPNSGGKRLRASNRTNELTDQNYNNKNSNNEPIYNNNNNNNNNNNISSALLFDSEFKTKKLKKHKSRELELPLSALCPICYESLNNLANLDNCTHDFCKSCIIEWSKKTNLCPLCKKEFKKIIFYEKGKPKEFKVKRRKLEIEDVMDESDFNELVEEPFRDQSCQICNRGNDEDNLLVCDGCGANVCHTYCDGFEAVPEGDWYCLSCRYTIDAGNNNNNINRSNGNVNAAAANSLNYNSNNLGEAERNSRVNYNNINNNNNFNNGNDRNTRNNNNVNGNRIGNNSNYNNNNNRMRMAVNRRSAEESEYSEDEDESYTDDSDLIDYSAEEEECEENSFANENEEEEESEQEEDFYIETRRRNKKQNTINTKNKVENKRLTKKRNSNQQKSNIKNKKQNKNNRRRISNISNTSNMRGANNKIISSSNGASSEKMDDFFDDLSKLDQFNLVEDDRLEKLKRNFNLANRKITLNSIKNNQFNNTINVNNNISDKNNNNSYLENAQRERAILKNINIHNNEDCDSEELVDNYNNISACKAKRSENDLLFQSQRKRNLDNICNSENEYDGKENKNNFEGKSINFEMNFDSNKNKKLKNQNLTASYEREFDSVKNKLSKKNLIDEDLEKYAYEEEKNIEITNFNNYNNSKRKAVNNSKNSISKNDDKNSRNFSFIKKEDKEETKFGENKNINKSPIKNNAENNFISNVNENLNKVKSKYASDSEEEEDYLEQYSKQKLNKQ